MGKRVGRGRWREDQCGGWDRKGVREGGPVWGRG